MDTIDPRLLDALITIESSNNPNAFNKGTGARGLTQITPIAWKDLTTHFPNVYSKLNYTRDIFNPDISRRAGEDYLKIIHGYLRSMNLPPTLDNVLGAYNWGIGNLKRHGISSAPQETRDYIRKITMLMKQK